MERLIIWLQLGSSMILLSDAYLPERIRQRLDELIKEAVGGYCTSYKQKYFRRDLAFFIVVIGAWILLLVFGQAGQLIAPVSGWIEQTFGISYIRLVLLALWALGFFYILSIAMAGIQHLDKFLHLVISFPLAMALYKAPKGPFFAIGFALLVISHLLQLVVAYDM